MVPAHSGQSTGLAEMRDPSGPEILIFARALLPLPAGARADTAARLLREVETADRQLRSFNRCHPLFGEGSLMSRCLMLSPPAERLARDPDFLSANITACQALLRHFKA
jgi:hypothetical protein